MLLCLTFGCMPRCCRRSFTTGSERTLHLLRACLRVVRMAEETAELKAANLAAHRVFTDAAAQDPRPRSPDRRVVSSREMGMARTASATEGHERTGRPRSHRTSIFGHNVTGACSNLSKPGLGRMPHLQLRAGSRMGLCCTVPTAWRSLGALKLRRTAPGLNPRSAGRSGRQPRNGHGKKQSGFWHPGASKPME